MVSDFWIGGMSRSVGVHDPAGAMTASRPIASAKMGTYGV